MRITAVIVAALVLVSSAFAYSDIGLLKKPRTISYYLLSVADQSSLSSGLVYNQQQNEKMALEVSYAGYKSFYLLTKNITKIRIDEKYKLFEFGPIGLTGLGGVAILYAPSVGGGVAADVGGILSAKVLEDLAFSLPLNFIIYGDGTEMDASATINYNPAFLKDYEIYGGGRVEAQMVGGLDSQGSQGGKVTFYLELGLRSAI